MKNIRRIAILFSLGLAVSSGALADICSVNAVRDGSGSILYTVTNDSGQVLNSSYVYTQAISFAESDVLQGYCIGVMNNVGAVIADYPVRYVYYPYVNGVYFLPGYRPGFYPYGYRPGFYYSETYYRGYGYNGPVYYGYYRNGVYEGYRGGGGVYRSYRDGFNGGYHSTVRVEVNRTTVNRTTVNRTTVNNRTTINNRTDVNRTTNNNRTTINNRTTVNRAPSGSSVSRGPVRGGGGQAGGGVRHH